MSNIDNYNAKLPIITAIPEKEVVALNMPVKAFLADAHYVYKWCQDDKKELIDVGMDWDMVMDVPVRSGAMRHSEAIWQEQRFNHEEAVKQWEAASTNGYYQRDFLLRTFRLAYRKNPALLTRVAGIAAGTGHADMIQDLSNLSVLGKANAELLLKIRFDLARLDHAADLSAELADMLAGAQVDRNQASESKLIRDQAFTHLKEAVDEIRAFGQYAFWENEKRLAGYVSQYRQKMSAKSNKEPQDTPAAENAETDQAE